MRIIDVVISILALTILVPIFAIISLILRFTGEGEVFFFQDRVGKFGTTFKVIKFVTMLKNSPNIGTGTITAKNDSRILPFGKVLRKTKINELPQFLNVFIGHMSLIGPRPHAERDLKGIKLEELNTILQLKPGLSGIGSIVFRDEEQILNTFKDSRPFYDQVIAPYKASLEVWYANRRSTVMDLQLIKITLVAVLCKKCVNVYKVYPDLPKPPESLKSFLVFD